MTNSFRDSVNTVNPNKQTNGFSWGALYLVAVILVGLVYRDAFMESVLNWLGWGQSTGVFLAIIQLLSFGLWIATITILAAAPISIAADLKRGQSIRQVMTNLLPFMGEASKAVIWAPIMVVLWGALVYLCIFVLEPAFNLVWYIFLLGLLLYFIAMICYKLLLRVYELARK